MINFFNLKGGLRKQTARALAQKFWMQYPYNNMLAWGMYCCRGPWEQAFSREKNLKVWAHTGLSPFNQRVLWQLLEKECRVSNVRESIKH